MTVVHQNEVKKMVENYRKLANGTPPFHDIAQSIPKNTRVQMQQLAAILFELILDVGMYAHGIQEQADQIRDVQNELKKPPSDNTNDCSLMQEWIKKMRARVRLLKDQAIINTNSARRLMQRMQSLIKITQPPSN
ncbi:MAG: hypothetical protein KGO83_00385 [Paenibacillaceae bacterium]|nr:hypothetical protein [Paenibacillaceae bacterium]